MSSTAESCGSNMTSPPSSSDMHSTTVLRPIRGTTAPIDVDPVTGRPFGAAEPKSYHHENRSIYKPSNSTHSLIPHEKHVINPIFTSPTPMSSHSTIIHQQYLEHTPPSRWSVLRYLLRKTCSWVIAGVFTMLLGIGLAQAFILPRIHTCPVSALCPGSHDPNSGNSLQLLQAFMSYWLKAGVTISSIGVLKLSAYQAWFILMHRGNTVKNLDLHLGAIRGSVTDACYLLFRKNNRLLSVFVFALLGIGTAISLVTGLSIEKHTEVKLLTFQYNASSELPNSSAKEINNDGQLKAAQKVIPWALDGDKNHDGAFRGTLVTPDARSSQASNALPGGPTINGHFVCEPWSNYTMPSHPLEWYIWFGENRFIATPDMSLSVSMWSVSTAVTKYLWVSNTTGLIPNATATKDGKMNIASCTHYLEMVPEEPNKPGFDYLMPTSPSTSGCRSDDSPDINICVADSVNNAILNWWGGLGTALWHMSCRGGVIGPTPSRNDEERYCPLTQELWKQTAISMMDAIIQTSPTSLPAIQDLHANVEGLSEPMWWLNAIIPAATVLVYLLGLGYTCMLSEGDKVLKELNLEEVVKAAQTDHVHDLVLSGQLRKTPIRFNSHFGFVDSASTTQRRSPTV